MIAENRTNWPMAWSASIALLTVYAACSAETGELSEITCVPSVTIEPNFPNFWAEEMLPICVEEHGGLALHMDASAHCLPGSDGFELFTYTITDFGMAAQSFDLRPSPRMSAGAGIRLDLLGAAGDLEGSGFVIDGQIRLEGAAVAATRVQGTLLCLPGCLGPEPECCCSP